ncbi:MAG TPA: beta-ketoacyl synthase chain length factor [Caldimonas sp.]|nr:beta-ketoacyl synthase chain length factor [Caldimonas sp.]
MNTARIEVAVLGVGLVGPGLASWRDARAILRAPEAWREAPTVLAPPSRLPAAERRRAGPSIRLAMAVADEAVAASGLDPSRLSTVFAASGGEGSNCHALCESLASPDRPVSPTRFTNSVQNAPAGYWHIAVASHASSTNLSAYDASFAAGLLEAAAQVATSAEPVLLVAGDVPYPPPLHHLRSLPHAVGVALVLARGDAGPAEAVRLRIALDAADAVGASRCRDPGLEWLRTTVPAARALPLLEAMARAECTTLCLESARTALRVEVESA